VIFPILHLSNNLKEKKRNINNDLAVLPSHDKSATVRTTLKQSIRVTPGRQNSGTELRQ